MIAEAEEELELKLTFSYKISGIST